jgi:hypothetical protein
MRLFRFVSVVLVLGMLLAVGAGSGAAQETECGPVAVGEGTGVYFLALGDNCSTAQAEGYILIAHLVRDDDSSEVLVLVDAEHDAETRQVAQLLAEHVKDGSVDGGTWHSIGANDAPTE